jgi:hypothetical protein
MTALTLERLDYVERLNNECELQQSDVQGLIDFARAHLAAWQPIESAPKDGNFLAWNGRSIRLIHNWRDIVDGIHKTPANFTYWMPLPSAPIRVSVGEPTPADRKCEPSGPTTRENGLQPPTTNTNGERDAVLRRTELVGKADVVDTGVERAQPETVAAPAITDPWFGSAKLEAPLPEPIAAGELTDDSRQPGGPLSRVTAPAYQNSKHQTWHLDAEGKPFVLPIAAGLSNIMSGLWRSAEDQVLELAKVLQAIAEEPVSWNTTDHHYYAGIVGRFQLLANGILKTSPPIAAGEEDVVVPFTGITKLDLPAERIIGGAAKANLDAVVIIGFDGDGDFFFSANKADGGEVLWLMELARKKLMEIGDQ